MTMIASSDFKNYNDEYIFRGNFPLLYCENGCFQERATRVNKHTTLLPHKKFPFTKDF